MQRLILVLRSAREVPDQPRVHRACQEFTLFGALASAFDVVQDPRPLRRRRIRIVQQPGLTQVLRGIPVVVRASVLPHDRVVNRLAGCFVPNHGGLALVRQPKGVNILLSDVLVGKCLAERPARVAPNLHRVVLHPTLARHDLLVLKLRLGDDLPVRARDAHACRRRTLVNRRNQSHARDSTVGGGAGWVVVALSGSFPVLFWRFLARFHCLSSSFR